ncbi:hypothetical protein [Yersinia aldovae]|nr:hypothetical protein [Yersinia aldovae]
MRAFTMREIPAISGASASITSACPMAKAIIESAGISVVGIARLLK